MIHLAIDHGKKVSHAVALSDTGEILFDQEIPSTLEGFASIKDALPADQSIQSIVEAGWNWGKVFDALEDLGLAGVAQNAGSIGKSREATAMTAGFGALAIINLWRSWKLWRDPAAREPSR